MAKIVDQFGRDIPKPETERIATVSGYGVRGVANDLSGVITLTPSQIRSYLQEAETGAIASQAALFEEMEKRDGTLDSHLRTRKMGVTSLASGIQPGDETPEAEKIADWCRDVVAEIGVDRPAGYPYRGMRAALFDLLDAVAKGFSVLEIEWRTTRAEWIPVALHYCPQRNFAVDEDGMTFRLRDENGSGTSELTPTNFIIHTAQARSGFAHNWSLARTLVRPFIMRNYSVKDWLGFAEVYGMPPRIGYLREGVAWDDAEATQLKAAVRAMGMDMAAIVTEGNKIDLLDVGKAGEGHVFQALLEWAERELTLAILGQTLTSGGESGGSYALGQVHNQVRHDLIEADAQDLEETLTNALLRPMVLLNFGPNAAVPKWNIEYEEKADTKAIAETLEIVGRATPDLPVSKRWLMDTFALVEPADEEDTITLGAGPAGGGLFANDVSGGPVPRGGKPVADARRPHGRRPVVSTPAQTPVETALNDDQFAAFCVRNDLAPRTFATMLCADDGGEPTPSELIVGREKGYEWMAERRVATADAWHELSPAGRQRAWYATGLNADGIGRMADLFLEAVDTQKNLNWFLDRLEHQRVSVPGAEEAGEGQLPNWHARLVWNQQVASLNTADMWIKAQEGKAERPFMRYRALPDARPDHRALDGVIKPVDDPFWDAHLPPWEFNCRCWTETLSPSEMEAEGLEVTVETPSVTTNPDWDFRKGDAFYRASEGEAPVSDAGRRDAEILAGLALPDYVQGDES